MKLNRSEGSRVVAISALLFCLLSPIPVKALTVVYHFGDVYSGASPASTSQPWVEAVFEDVSPGTVSLSISNPNLTGSENVGNMYFNLNPNLNPLDLTFTADGGSGGFVAPTISTGTDNFKAGGGKYDILFAFSEGSACQRFTSGESVEYLISGISGLMASDFAYLSTAASGHSPFFAATHVERIGSESQSGWIAVTSVPEPRFATLAGLALSLWFGRSLWRRYAKG